MQNHLLYADCGIVRNVHSLVRAGRVEGIEARGTPRVYIRASSRTCACMRHLILRFSRKTSDQSELRPMAVEAWRSRCELYMRIYPYTALATAYPFLAPLPSLLSPSLHSARPATFIQPDIALLVCSIFSRTSHAITDFE